MSDPKFGDIPRNQRIVLEHTQGPYAGLFQILGHSDEFGGENPPTFTDGVEILMGPATRMAAAGLVSSHPRYLLYREISAPEGQRGFHEEQQ